MKNKKKILNNHVLNEGYKNNPELFDNANGSRIIIGNKDYLDLSFAAGSLLLGHQSKIFIRSLKEIIKDKFLNRFKNLEEKFKKSEFIYLLIYRFIGGIPFALSNILPCMFNVKVSNFFWASAIGMIPQLFLVVSIGSGLEKIINENLEFDMVNEFSVSKFQHSEPSLIL